MAWYTVSTVEEDLFIGQRPVTVEADSAKQALEKVWDMGYTTWLKRVDGELFDDVRPATNLEIEFARKQEEFIKACEQNAPKEEE